MIGVTPVFLLVPRLKPLNKHSSYLHYLYKFLYFFFLKISFESLDRIQEFWSIFEQEPSDDIKANYFSDLSL